MAAPSYNSASDPYFRRGGIETLAYLQAKLGAEGYEAYLIGMIHKKLHKAFLSPVHERDGGYHKAARYMAELSKIRGNTDRETLRDRDTYGGAGANNDLAGNFSRLAIDNVATGSTAPDHKPTVPATPTFESPSTPSQNHYGPGTGQRIAS